MKHRLMSLAILIMLVVLIGLFIIIKIEPLVYFLTWILGMMAIVLIVSEIEKEE